MYESTVYRRCTEENCISVLEQASGLNAGEVFFYGYSPERIVPGDKNRPLSKILKIISASDEATLSKLEKVYSSIIEAGLYKASSVKVAEAAKVIENTQRDINISLMNELSIIFNKIGIDTKEVIEAAGSKWNFHKYYPGLVGGHCIGVDPYYLMHKAKELGHDPQVIAAGRRINDGMPNWVAKKLTQKLIENGKNPGECKVLVMGVTFKENVSDIRNSKVVDLIKELMDYSINVHTIDPHASPNELAHEYGISLIDSPVILYNHSYDTFAGGALLGREADEGSLEAVRGQGTYDAIIIAVAHDEYKNITPDQFRSLASDPFMLFDLKGVHSKSIADLYWTL